MSESKKIEKIKFTKFEQTVFDVSSQMPDRKMLPGSIQDFILFYQPQLVQLLALEERFKKYYRTANRAQIIALACRYFLNQTEEPEKKKK